jgi:predicted NUDIX family phosphoesterase
MILKSQFLAIASAVLELERRPLSARQIVELGLSRHLFSDRLAGRTPWQTMKSKLSVHIRRYGDTSPFIRTGPGRFQLRRLLGGDQAVYDAKPIAPPISHEKVLVFPTKLLTRAIRFQGISKRWRVYKKRVLESGQCLYLDRMEAERDDAHKQVLTYILVTRGRRILAYRRGTYTRAADELRGAYCVGFGGHVSESDNTLFSWRDFGLLNSAARELSEELTLPEKDQRRISRFDGLRIVGVLNDDSSALGRRHFAFILRYEMAEGQGVEVPQRGEKSVTRLSWLDSTSPRLSLSDFEYWSQLCLREYYPEVVRAQPTYVIRRRRPLIPPHILVVVGALGSGKSEATRILVNEYAYREVNSGRVVAELLGVPPVPITDRREFQKLALDFIARSDGSKDLAAAIAKRVVESDGPRVLVDGIRQRRTLDELRNCAVGRRIGVLFVHTPPDVAFEFSRRRSPDITSMAEFLRLREAEVESEVGDLIGISDAVIYNWFGRNLYRETLRSLMRSLGVPRTAER